jgi:exonuclease SbcD
MVIGGGSLPELSDSEFCHIGGVEAVNVSVFRGFDYVALGHIHSPMNMGSEKVRYCGAPLKYALSKRERDKSVTILDVGSTVSWYTVPLHPLRDVRFVTGTLEEIVARGKEDPDKEDYIKAFVTGNPPDALARIREVYPNALAIEFDSPEHAGIVDPVETDLNELNAMEEFEKFFRRKYNEDLTESQRKLLQELFEANGVVL